MNPYNAVKPTKRRTSLRLPRYDALADCQDLGTRIPSECLQR